MVNLRVGIAVSGHCDLRVSIFPLSEGTRLSLTRVNSRVVVAILVFVLQLRRLWISCILVSVLVNLMNLFRGHSMMNLVTPVTRTGAVGTDVHLIRLTNHIQGSWIGNIL